LNSSSFGTRRVNNSTFHIVFTDLDGTLLDHHDYSYDLSMPGIALLRGAGIPLVLVSSKTASEMEALRRKLGLAAPFVCENGGGIAFPSEHGKEPRIEAMGMSAAELEARSDLLKRAAGRRIRLITDMDPNEIAALTGLEPEAARKVRERSHSIPFLTADGSSIDLPEVNRLLGREGLAVTRGGRFYHLGTAGVDKGLAVSRILAHYRPDAGEADIVTTGLGDSENDLPMLKAVDRPVLVRKPDGSFLKTDMDVILTEGRGPAGFTEAIFRLFARGA